LNRRLRREDLSVGIRPAIIETGRRAGAYPAQKQDAGDLNSHPRYDSTPRWLVILARSLPVLDMVGKAVLKIVIVCGLVVGAICLAIVGGVLSTLLGSDTAQARAGARRRKWP
jgi:hypothetical protein